MTDPEVTTRRSKKTIAQALRAQAAREAQEKQFEDLCLERALRDGDPQAGMFAIACAVLRLGDMIIVAASSPAEPDYLDERER